MKDIKALVVSEDELRALKEKDEDLWVSKDRIVDQGMKISGSSDAQVGAQLMYHITQLDRLLKDLPFAGLYDGKAVVLKSSITE